MRQEQRREGDAVPSISQHGETYAHSTCAGGAGRVLYYIYILHIIFMIYIYITYKWGKERASRSTARRAPTAPARVTQGGYYIIFILHITFMIYKSFAGDAAYISICIPTHAYTSCFIYIDIYMYIHTYIHI